jgi:hypothetical protein
MFLCNFCQKVSAPGEKMTRVPSLTRDKEYPQRWYRAQGREIRDPGGQGQETVLEQQACEECAPVVSALAKRGSLQVSLKELTRK